MLGWETVPAGKTKTKQNKKQIGIVAPKDTPLTKLKLDKDGFRVNSYFIQEHTGHFKEVLQLREKVLFV